MDTFDFFTDQRLDLVCKYAFFNDLKNQTNDEFVCELYKKHILKRTKGREPRDRFNKAVRKVTIDDYIESAIELYRNMSQNGFDEKYPIPYTDEGMLLNGAHRIACAAVLNIDIITNVVPQKDHTRKAWDLKWFQKNDFSDEQIQYILNLYNTIRNTNEKVTL